MEWNFTWAQLLYLYLYYVSQVQSFLDIALSSVRKIGYGGYHFLERLPLWPDLHYTPITLWESFRVLFLPILGGLSFFYFPYFVWYAQSLSLTVQQVNNIMWEIFLQYALPVLIASAFAALTAWFANRKSQKKEDIEYWKDAALNLRKEFDTLRLELSEVKAQNLRYELAFMYLRNEPDVNQAMIRTAQAIIEGTMTVTRRREDEGK